MSYVNLYLGDNFASVVSDTQITKSDGTVSEKEMKKFLVTDQKVLIATTGNADVAKILFGFLEEHKGLHFSEVRMQVAAFLEQLQGVTDEEGGKISQKVIVAGFENGTCTAVAFIVDSYKALQVIKYGPGDVIHLTPEDYSFDIAEYFNRLKTDKLSDLVAHQEKALLRVSRHSQQVNNKINKEVMVDVQL